MSIAPPKVAGTVEVGPIAGIILAGGRSRRMGTDKAALGWQDRPLLRHLVEVLQTRVRPLIVVARPGQELPALPDDVRVIFDPVPDQGPLVALRHAWPSEPAGFVFVTGCDYPFLTAELPGSLAGLIGLCEAAVPRVAGQAHPLLALYRTQVFNNLTKVTEGGSQSMAALLDTLDVRWVEGDEWETLDPEGRIAWNVNTAAEYQRAQQFESA